MKKELLNKIINLEINSFMKESNSYIEHLCKRIKFYEYQIENLKRNKFFKFQKKKIKEQNKKIEEYNNKIIELYKKIEEEYDLNIKLNDSIY